MKLQLIIFAFFLLGTAGNCIDQKQVIPDGEIIQEPRDREIFEEMMQKFSGKKGVPMGELIIAIGKSLEGTPYVGGTLEKGDDEKLVVNLREMDCTTFVENCLALARTIKSGEPDYDSFLQELQQIRYRNGLRNLYPSRLHYFSEWLLNNAEKNVISLPAKGFGEIYPNRVDFMSKHPGSYPCLKAKPEFVAEMEKLESIISANEYYFVPKEKIAAIENLLQEGDFAGITTGIEGLDIVHSVLLTRVSGRIHILHASSSAKKVVVSDEPLADYILKSKTQTGIMVGRPL
ncbi:MAG TPA: DUF1460 domain-containing protein [Prolixibacteraceae bacterium]|nr:DUF1460 domain-containing protein [Prolixibacteraceae bacterium]HCR91237.1 DUF1460 domain-containing protein [Prolixibacteraceae bacterium]HCU60433.1 DUF1460 domain-containing protein [Prolixibacteraceae bacterium]